MTAQLTTNTAPRQMAVNRKDVAELVDLIANEVIRRIDQRETSRMISNAVRDGVASHMAKQNAAKPAEVDIFAGYTIEGDAATYMNNLLEQK
jgi:hypothetical protein